jgi:hypothetical protein
VDPVVVDDVDEEVGAKDAEEEPIGAEGQGEEEVEIGFGIEEGPGEEDGVEGSSCAGVIVGELEEDHGGGGEEASDEGGREIESEEGNGFYAGDEGDAAGPEEEHVEGEVEEEGEGEAEGRGVDEGIGEKLPEIEFLEPCEGKGEGGAEEGGKEAEHGCTENEKFERGGRCDRSHSLWQGFKDFLRQL